MQSDLSLFLTDEELTALTGSPQPATQERVLREWGLNVTRNRVNKIMLTREALTRHQLGLKTETRIEPKLRLHSTE
ncbi:MAG: DUF4224 domain-containing protein [Sulfuriferula sp.]